MLTVPSSKQTDGKLVGAAALKIPWRLDVVLDCLVPSIDEAPRVKSCNSTSSPPGRPAPGLLAVADQPAPHREEQIASTLPKTGTYLPLVGLLGGVTVAMSLGLSVVRKVMKG